MSRTLIWLFVGGFLGFLVVVGVFNLETGPYQYQGSQVDPPIPAADFSLIDQEGQPVRMSDHRGNVVLLFFGYTGCPDVCPTTLSDFKKVHTALGDQAGDVSFMFITVDPERDTPAKMGQYVAQFHPDFIGLSGSEEALKEAWDGYFIFRQPADHEPGEYYTVDHSARVYAVDKAGNLRLTFPFGLGSQAIAEDIRHLLNE